MYSFAPSRLCAKYLILFSATALLRVHNPYTPLRETFLPQRQGERKVTLRNSISHHCWPCDQQLLTSNYVFFCAFAPLREIFDSLYLFFSLSATALLRAHNPYAPLREIFFTAEGRREIPFPLLLFL